MYEVIVLHCLVEHMMAKLTHHEQIEKSPPAPDTSGSVLESVAAGTEVGGGFKQ